MEDLSPQARRRRIALITLLLGVMCAIYWPILGSWMGDQPVSILAVLRSLVIGLALGAAFGLVAVEFPARLIRLGKHRPIVRAVTSGGPLIYMACLMTLLMYWGSPMGIFALPIWMIPAGIAVGLIAAGRAVRVGESRHCPKCDYEYAFADDAAPPPQCPECGVIWLGKLVTGRKQRSVPLIASGIGVFAAMALMLAAVAQGSALARVMPTSTLLQYVRIASPLSESTWAELGQRTLTPNQRERLARRLLDNRNTGRRMLNYNATKWLAAEVGAGRLSPELRERFFAEMFRGDLDVPRRVRAGEPFKVGFRRTDAADGGGYRLFLYLGGFAVGDDNPPIVGRSTEGHYPILIDRANRSSYSDEVTVTLVAPTPGRTTVRANVWLIVQTGAPARITWNDDGTPVVPPAAAWVKHLPMTAEVEVVP